jgi:NADP-dependent aldehyde dehydrogenase
LRDPFRIANVAFANARTLPHRGTTIMNLTGHNLVGGDELQGGGSTFHGVNATTGESLDPRYHEASQSDIDRAVRAAEHAFLDQERAGPDVRAAFLRTIADELVALGDTLIERASLETALPSARLIGERTRTVNQLRMFADLLDEGSWVEARIDAGDTARSPVPKPDLRRMLVPLGPVAVFGASNFPFAFSVPGGDTASALAAGCTVVCKAHPAHPGTSELAARAIRSAARSCGLSPAVFSLVHGTSHESGIALVNHPLIAAVGFTGSLRGGRALYNAAAARPVPIPVYAEMGSINPVFLLPSAVESRGDEIARALAQSVTAGVGQFCTNPGVLIGLRGSALDRLRDSLAEQLDRTEPGVMLHAAIANAYSTAVERALQQGAVRATASAGSSGRGQPMLLTVDADRFIANATLHEEMFGPISMLVSAGDTGALERAAESLEGQLSATIFGSPDDLVEHARLVELLKRRVGRIIFNGVPTGVEVGHAIHHGGPYPASTDSRSTSVGTAAITRFARPVCFQDFPDAALPSAIRNHNTSGIWRLVDGRLTKDDVT